jgi:hypothetical protein
MSKQKKRADATTANLRTGECVFVRWADHYGFNGRKNVDERVSNMGCSSVGWIVRKTDCVVSLAPNVNAKEGILMGRANDQILIPISAITYVGRVSLPSPPGDLVTNGRLDRSKVPRHFAAK